MSRSWVRRVIGLTVLAGSLSLIATSDAHAYLDFGSGSFVLQLILAGFLGALYAIRAYLRRVRDRVVDFFGGGRRLEPRDPDSHERP
jgi:hypothetical protein